MERKFLRELPLLLWLCYHFGMQMLDGKKTAERILSELKQDVAGMHKLRLGVVVVGDDPVIKSFIAQKKKAANAVGVDVRIYPFPADITTNELRRRLAEVVHEGRNTGIIIQLPLPPHINVQYILNAIPPEQDADVLSARAVGDFATGKGRVLPPVAGAIKALLDGYAIPYRDMHSVILGAGRLVGRPTALWLMQERAPVTVISERAEDRTEIIRTADIVISGIGRPRFVTGDMIKDGAILIDAGSSESEGEVVGDMDETSVAPKAAYLAPVPGGVGPMTVAMLLKNVVALAKV